MPDEPSNRDTAADPLPAEPVPATPLVEPHTDPGYTDSGVPTFDSVRERIETRYRTSQGAAELDAESPDGRSVEDQYEARQKAAAERLAQIRASMHSERKDDA
jgi:phage shock protein A